MLEQLLIRDRMLWRQTVLDLYEEYDLDHRLMKIDEEWPGAVILLHKIGRLPPVSVNRLHQVTWYVVVIVTWSDSPPDVFRL